MAPVGDLGNDPTEHRVAEELEAFVGGLTSHLGTPRAVGQGTSKQRLIDEVVPEPSD